MTSTEPWPTPIRAALSIWAWLTMALLVLIWVPLQVVVYLATFWWDRPRWYAGRMFRLSGVLAAKLNPFWLFRVHGRLPAELRGRAFVAVCNHESAADPYLLSHYPWEMKWLTKAELFRVPPLAALLWTAGDVPVSRGNPRSAIRSLQECGRWLARGASVMVFPEGTRSDTGRTGVFRDGAFKLAIDAQAPVLLLCLSGTGRSLPKGSLLFTRTRASARVLGFRETNGLGRADTGRLRDECREVIEAGRAVLAAELAA